MVKPTAPARTRPYHHGNLRQALLDAALTLAQQHGVERVSVREAARLLGVSPAAPFRHFPTRRALMTAVAEQASERLRIEVRKQLRPARQSGLGQLRALARGYLQWAGRHPAHFRIVSARDQIDVAASPALQHSMLEVRALTEAAVATGQQQGLVSRVAPPAALALLARATAYGLARMQLDDHFAQWGVAPQDVAETQLATLDLLVSLMAGAADAVQAPPSTL